MSRIEQLHFESLPAEAQRAALRRLALSGLTAEQVASRVGWSVAEVRRAMNESPTRPLVSPRAAARSLFE